MTVFSLQGSDLAFQPPRASAQNYEVDGAGVVRRMGSPTVSLLRRFSLRRPYRLYRFLSHPEDLVGTVRNERERLRVAAVLVRHLLAESAWIAESCPLPDPALGWAVSFLYDEPGYPFTVQLVSWLPGQGSPVHNHAAWGIVALLGDPERDGHEENTLWRQTEQGGTEKRTSASVTNMIRRIPQQLRPSCFERGAQFS